METQWASEECKLMTSLGDIWHVHSVSIGDQKGVPSGTTRYNLTLLRIRRRKNVFYAEGKPFKRVICTSEDLRKGDWLFQDRQKTDITRLRGIIPVSSFNKGERLAEEVKNKGAAHE